MSKVYSTMAESVAVVIVGHSGLVVGVGRRNNPADLNLIGGKVECVQGSDGRVTQTLETPLQAVERETLEEAGVRLLEVVPILSRKSDTTFCHYFFARRYWQLRDPDPALTVLWAKREELVSHSWEISSVDWTNPEDELVEWRSEPGTNIRRLWKGKKTAFGENNAAVFAEMDRLGLWATPSFNVASYGPGGANRDTDRIPRRG